MGGTGHSNTVAVNIFIIPRIPFPVPTVLDGHIESSYINMRNEAIRRLRQGLGRGLRRTSTLGCDFAPARSTLQECARLCTGAFSSRMECPHAGGRPEGGEAIKDRAFFRTTENGRLNITDALCHACSFEPKVRQSNSRAPHPPAGRRLSG